MMAAPQPDDAVAFTYCVNFGSAETKSATWSKFAATVSRSEPFDTKEQSIRRAAIVGGVREDETAGRAENVITRTVLTLDYDDFPDGTNLDEIEFALEMAMDCAFVAYSTFRHTPEAPRIRVMAPFSRVVTADEYPLVVDAVAKLVGLVGMDSCSKVIGQIMFLASNHTNVEPWSIAAGVGCLDVDALGIKFGAITRTEDDSSDIFDLDLAFASQPLDLSDGDVAQLLENYPSDSLDYDGWAKVGMAIAHQYESSDAGYAIWVEWSKLDTERFKQREMRTKWRSFGGRTNPVTMASIIKAAGGLSGGALAISPTSDTAMTLRDEAQAVSDMASYSTFKKRVVTLSTAQLPQDIRSVLAAEVHKAFGKGEGMGLRDIKTAFSPPKNARPVGGEMENTPDWLAPWIYYELDNEFVSTDQPEYRINSRAFDAKFSRMSEAASAEMPASIFAISRCEVPTVSRMYFMPDTEEIITERDGLTVLNTYRRGGVTPCEVLDDEGQEAVDLFLAHIKNTFSDEREQTILLDWMAHVYVNAGQRVNWAMLIWGVEGNGKTIFFNILQCLIGRLNTKDISPSAINSQYNDWAAGGIVGCVEEIRIAGSNKWQILDSMKPAISNDTLAIHPKGKAMFANAPNHCSYMMTTNHSDAVPMSQNDRRFCVLFSRQEDKEALFNQHGGEAGTGAYFKKLFGLVIKKRSDAIARFLLDYKISDDFDYKGRAPKTYGLEQMREANVSEDVAAIRALLEDHGSVMLNDRMICITELKAVATMRADWEMPTTKALGRLLREEGFFPVSSKWWRVKGVKHYVWTRKSRITEDEAKEMTRNYYNTDEGFEDVPF